VHFLLFRICGEPLAFLIEVNGQRIYIDSGATLTQLPPNERVGLVIRRMALLDFRARLAATVAHLQPRYFFTESSERFLPALQRGPDAASGAG
jgi:hypothetical protein